MSHPLDTSRAKVRKADEDIAGLNESVQGIFDPGPYTIVPEFNPETRQHTLRAKRTANLPLIDWGTRIGGIAHDLRSALNYIVTALVRANRNTLTRQHEFPIFDDADLYAERDGRGRPTRRSGLGKLAGVDSEAATLVESLQPYHGVNPIPGVPPKFVTSALWGLHELNRVDKHQELIVPTPIIKESTISGAPIFTLDEQILPGPLEDDAVLARFTEKSVPGVRMGPVIEFRVPRSAGGSEFTPAGDVHVPMQAHFTFDVAFTETGPMNGGLVVDSLTQIAARVATTVESFARFF